VHKTVKSRFKMWTTIPVALLLFPLLCVVLLELTARFTSLGCVACRNWARLDRWWMDIETWQEQVTRCPCTAEQAKKRPDVFISDRVPSLHQPCTEHYDKPGCTAFSFRTTAKNGAGNQCCYDIHGALITSGLSAGTIDRYSPSDVVSVTRHIVHDVLPYLTCCYFCRGDCTTCSLYIQGRRPLWGEEDCKLVPSENYACDI